MSAGRLMVLSVRLKLTFCSRFLQQESEECLMCEGDNLNSVLLLLWPEGFGGRGALKPSLYLFQLAVQTRHMGEGVQT